MEPAVSPFEEPDASFHLSAFLRCNHSLNNDRQADGRSSFYNAALRLSKTASQLTAGKQMLEEALAAQARPHDNLTPLLQSALQRCPGWGPHDTACNHQVDLMTLQQCLAMNHSTGMECLQAAMLAPDSVIVGGSKACDELQLYFQSPTHGDGADGSSSDQLLAGSTCSLLH